MSSRIEVWFERVTLPRLLWASWKGRGKTCQVVGRSTSRWAQAAAASLGVGLRIETIEFGKRDPDGSNLRYAVEAAIAHLGNRLITALGPLAAVLPPDYRAGEEDWRRLLRSHLAAHVLPTIVFLYNAALSPIARGEQEGEVLVYLSPRFLAGFVASNLPPIAGARLTVRAWPGLVELLAFFPLPGMIGVALHEVLRGWRAGVPETVVDPEARRQGVALEQYASGMLKSYPAGGLMFWHQPSGLPAERVVMLVNRPDSPLDDTSRALFRRHGFGWVDGRHPVAFLPHPLRDGLRILWQALAHLPRRPTPLEFWRWLMVAHMSVVVEGFRHMVRRVNALQLHQCDEQAARPLALVLAARQEGAMFFWNHWSVSHFPKARESCGIADLLLAWGEYDEGFRTALGFDYRWVARTGPVVDAPLDPALLARGPELRAMLDPGVRFVIVLFDSSHGPDCHQPTETLIDFLTRFFTGVQQRRDWGILLKSKKQDPFASLPDQALAQARRGLELEKRLVCLDPGIQPSVAAGAGDICVSYSINTAGVLSALATGKPSVHCDVVGMNHHFLYRAEGHDLAVFQDQDALFDALDRAATGDASVGAFATLPSLFSPFGDDLGNQRAGQLIGAYFAGRDRGMARDEALDAAVAQYGDRHGMDRVATARQAAERPVSRQWAAILDELRLPPYPPVPPSGTHPS
ncbi:MAG: hypothetical protein HQL42_02565 [Alphaproteobacteria bacterium]|nr:hypothetical protein [Alphaproteobacteria bacterium]